MTAEAFKGMAPDGQPLPGENDYLAEIISRPVAEPAGQVIQAIDSGPFDPALSLPRDEAIRLCDPEPMEVENGWARLPGGGIQVAFQTALPGVTAEMIEWWSNWHPLRDDRYRAWHPQEHFGNRVLPGGTREAKPYWGTAIFFDEDVGGGRTQLRTEFSSPSSFGFSGSPFADPIVKVIISARVGDAAITHTDMAHVFIEEDEGLMLRSRFWIAHDVRPRYPGSAAATGDEEKEDEGAATGGTAQNPALLDPIGPAVARHGAEEYAQLGQILPGLYGRFSDA